MARVHGPGRRRARQLTSDPASDTQPTFSPDGKWIAFVSRRGDDKQNQIYVISTEGGEARRVTQVPTGAGAPKWFPDSRRIAFVSSVWPDLVRWEDQGARMQERQEPKMTARVWDRAPIAYWDHFLDEREPHLFSIDRDGGEPLAITRLSGYALPRSGRRTPTATTSRPTASKSPSRSNVDKSGVDPNFDVITAARLRLQAGAKNVTSGNPADDGEPRYSPDGRWLAFVQQRIKRFYADRARLMLLDRAAGTARGLTENWDRTVSHVSWLPGSTRARGVNSTMRPRSRVYRFDLSGAPPKAITTTPSFSGVSVAAAAPKAAVVALRQSFTEPPTLVRLDLGSGKVTQLSTFNDAKLGGHRASARWRASPTRARAATTSRCGWCIRRASIRRRNIPCTCCCMAGRTTR